MFVSHDGNTRGLKGYLDNRRAFFGSAGERMDHIVWIILTGKEEKIPRSFIK